MKPSSSNWRSCGCDRATSYLMKKLLLPGAMGYCTSNSPTSAPLDHSIETSESVYLFCAPDISLTLHMLGERGSHKSCSDGEKVLVAGLRNWEPLAGSLHAGNLGVMVTGLHEWSDMYLRQLPGRPSSLIQGCTACPR